MCNLCDRCSTSIKNRHVINRVRSSLLTSKVIHLIFGSYFSNISKRFRFWIIIFGFNSRCITLFRFRILSWYFSGYIAELTITFGKLFCLVWNIFIKCSGVDLFSIWAKTKQSAKCVIVLLIS